MQIRQALQRPVQKPARLWNALDDSGSATPGDADRPTPLGPPLLLAGEDRVRWVSDIHHVEPMCAYLASIGID